MQKYGYDKSKILLQVALNTQSINQSINILKYYLVDTLLGTHSQTEASTSHDGCSSPAWIEKVEYITRANQTTQWLKEKVKQL